MEKIVVQSLTDKNLDIISFDEKPETEVNNFLQQHYKLEKLLH